MSGKISYSSVLQAVKLGALLGFCAALVYGILFVVYGIARTSLVILSSPANELLPTLLANSLSVLIGAMFFAVVFGLFAALFQALTLTLIFFVHKAVAAYNLPRKGELVGLVVAVILFAGLLLLFQGSPRILFQVFWNQSFVFWFGLPGMIYLLMNVWLGRRLSAGALIS